MQEIEELPPNLTPAQTVELVNDRIRQINAALRGVQQNPGVTAADIGLFRIVNLADPKDDLDGVNLRTLKRWRPIEAQQIPTAAGRGLDGYCITFVKDGTLSA